MQDFSIEGVRRMFGRSVCRGSRQNFTIMRRLKFEVIFRKFPFKIIGKFQKKRNFLTKTFILAAIWENKYSYIHRLYGGFGGRAPKLGKI